MLKSIFILMAFAAIVNGQYAKKGPCPSVSGMVDFNPKRIVGVWYPVKAYRNKDICPTYEIGLRSDSSIMIVYQQTIKGTVYKRWGSVCNFERPSCGRCKWERPAVSRCMKTYSQIVDVRYDRWAILHTCEEYPDYHIVYNVILVRDPFIYVAPIISTCERSMRRARLDVLYLRPIPQITCPRLKPKNTFSSEEESRYCDDEMADEQNE